MLIWGRAAEQAADTFALILRGVRREERKLSDEVVAHSLKKQMR